MSNYYNEAKEFATQYVLPRSTEIDEHGIFPEDIFKELGNQGYFNLLIPTEYGGQGKGLPEHSEVCMALAESCATVGLCYMMHNVALMCLATYGSEELKKKVFIDIIENKKFMALAFSEFGTGTHFYISGMEAIANGDSTTFNGYKSMVTSGSYASYYLVLAPSAIEGQVNNWLFPVEAEGLTFEADNWNGLGMRGNSSCPMKVENVTLDSSYRIGEEGSGNEQAFTVVSTFFVTGLASVYSGVCLNVSNVVNEYTINRKYPDGSSLASIDTVQIHLGAIYTKAMAAKMLTAEAARSAANGEEDAEAKVLAARIFASEAAIECSTIGMRVGGGKAYNKAYKGGLPVERLLRDSLAGQVMAPSVDVLKLWLGKAVTNQPLL